MEDAIRDWLEHDYVGVSITREGFKKLWGSALQRLRKSPSHAIPFFRLEGVSGFTQRSKAEVLLAWYHHRNGKPLGAAMLRYMAVRLWANLKFTLPDGKNNLAKERDYFVATQAGKFVLHHSGFCKSKTERNIIGWQEDFLSSFSDGSPRHIPIVETTTKKVRLKDTKAAPISRAIGAELRDAVEYALGPLWYTNGALRDRAALALSASNR
ncbi:hypothetical protein R5H32_02700 [Defluviimonas sp. D31]|uniref:hypothetical protein n=1 Tax=Defluviimonas sp. D31 TaxID=3083253 RepID=UPI00296E316E|nr:hypothetical protein [Defluviimonas sp. D31]MDW4548257.1 hypothetical protein [Defluviimonas sp. D31]